MPALAELSVDLILADGKTTGQKRVATIHSTGANSYGNACVSSLEGVLSSSNAKMNVVFDIDDNGYGNLKVAGTTFQVSDDPAIVTCLYPLTIF